MCFIDKAEKEQTPLTESKNGPHIGSASIIFVFLEFCLFAASDVINITIRKSVNRPKAKH